MGFQMTVRNLEGPFEHELEDMAQQVENDDIA